MFQKYNLWHLEFDPNLVAVIYLDYLSLDKNIILIELENSAWRFYSVNGSIDVETGLYFGNKNNYLENQNIFISGLTEKDDQVIKWEITKIE